MEDITPRAKRILQEVELIAAEDTRVAGRLLSILAIPGKRVISCFKGNETKQTEVIIHHLSGGNDVALISDAGTPGVSDPGSLVVRKVVETGATIVPVPGPSALVAAFSVSGFLNHRFFFEGFLPRRGKERKVRLEAISVMESPVIFYEAPHRFLKTTKDLINHCGADRVGVVGREITKMFEEFFRGSLQEILEYFTEKGVKGEFVIVMDGINQIVSQNMPPVENEVERLLGLGLTPKTLSSVLCTLYSLPRKEIYSLALELQDN
jgi:16S rRNA (cytidine1402-2'-O)-methyltransferase